MWLTGRWLPAFHVNIPASTFLAGALALAGVLVAAAGVIEFRRAQTTVNPMAPEAASTLVTRGVYRFSRNPMYLGFALALLGWAVFLSNAAALLGIVAYVWYLTRFQIVPEERMLEGKFGPAFAAYRSAVRRWL